MAKSKEPKTEAAVIEKPATPRVSTKVPKLEKKNKSRLPRKEKKAQLKAANRASGGK